jgi:hypothetical protein
MNHPSPPSDRQPEIVVEFHSAPGRRQVSAAPGEAVRESARALERSMETIQQMARRFAGAMDQLEAIRPDEMELEFGIKFDTEVGAIIARTGIEANLKVKLVWKGERRKEAADGS